MKQHSCSSQSQKTEENLQSTSFQKHGITVFCYSDQTCYHFICQVMYCGLL